MMIKKLITGLICITLILAFSCLTAACLSPKTNDVSGQVSETETAEPVLTSEPDPTEAAPTQEPDPTAPPSESPAPVSVSALPDSLSEQAIEADCSRYRASVQQASRYVSSYIPFMIDEEDAKIRKAMNEDFFGDTVWNISSLEYTLRLSNSVSEITEDATVWYDADSVTETVWGAEASSWTAKGSLADNKIGAIDQAIDNYFKSAVRISEPDASYNAHSYAWSGGRTDCGWLEDPLPLMQDPAVTVETEPQPGDVVVYLAPSKDGGDIPVHSAIVREMLGDTVIVESKLGQCGVYRHAMDYVPNEYYYSERTEGEGEASVFIGELRYLILRATGMNTDPKEVVYPDGFSGFEAAADVSDVLPAAYEAGIASVRPRHMIGTAKKDDLAIIASLTDTMPQEALSEEELKELEDWMDKYLPFCFMMEQASSDYNGHSYAWSGGKKDQGWLQSPASLWEKEGVSLTEDVQPGDVIVYVKCGEDGLWHALHSAIVREVAGETVLVESKFGNGGLYLHEMSDVPGEWMSLVQTTSNGRHSSWNEAYYLAFRLP